MKNLKTKKQTLEELKRIEFNSLFKKNDYLTSLENCEDSEFFRTYLVFSSAALDSYITQSRTQTKESFTLAKYFTIVGFAIILLGVGISYFAPVSDNIDKEFLSLVTTGSGIISEMIAATIFILYSKTLKQFNLTLNKIMEMQSMTLPLIEKQIDKNQSK